VRILICTFACALLALPFQATAQSTLTYRAQVSAETTARRVNEESPLTPDGSDRWTQGRLFLATGSGSWERGRLRLAGGLALSGATDGGLDAQSREGYARISVTDWLDMEAGKRLLRWGVGYGFSPAGVLDPPRLATDPTDRLGVNEGRPLARVDLFRGGSSVTLAAAAGRTVAARARTVLPGGLEVAVIASSSPGTRPSWGGTVTHVVGQQLEWHAEVIEQKAGGSRALSAVAGVQYTFHAGVNVVLEYHRNGRGLDGEEWAATLQGSRPPGSMPGRQQFVFLRAARSSADAVFAPELILISGLDDGSLTLVPGLTWTPAGRMQIHARATRLAGGRRSFAGVAPWTTSLTVGATLRF
jgi:hypothetical protein